MMMTLGWFVFMRSTLAPSHNKMNGHGAIRAITGSVLARHTSTSAPMMKPPP